MARQSTFYGALLIYYVRQIGNRIGKSAVPDYQYVAWFRESTLEPDDPDYEWPMCFLVFAANSLAAQSWGDVLARDYSKRAGCEFLRSYLDQRQWEDGQVPRVTDGEVVSDEIMGW